MGTIPVRGGRSLERIVQVVNLKKFTDRQQRPSAKIVVNLWAEFLKSGVVE